MEQTRYHAFQTNAPQTDAVVTPRRAFDPQMTPIYIGLAVGWAILLIAMPLVGLSLDFVLTGAFLVVCGCLSWTAVCLRLRGLSRIAMAVEAWGLFTASCMAGVLATYVVARFSAPFADGWMASADRWIASGLDWRETVLALARHPLLIHCANRAYASFGWQSSLLILLCCATGHTDRCAEFVLRWTITLALVCAVFALFPCNGPYFHYGIAHSAVPDIGSGIGWRQPELLAWLRSSGTLRLDPATLDGIVEFPSFHAAGGIVLAWGFWAIRWARWPMLALNLAMIAAAVPIGGHYYVDLLAGALTAWVAIALPGWLSKLRTAWFDSRADDGLVAQAV